MKNTKNGSQTAWNAKAEATARRRAIFILAGFMLALLAVRVGLHGWY